MPRTGTPAVVETREATLKAKQDAERRATNAARQATPPPKAEGTARAKRIPPSPKQHPQSKAEKVRAYLAKHADARPVDVAKATGVEASYVWDIRAAMLRKAAKASGDRV